MDPVIRIPNVRIALETGTPIPAADYAHHGLADLCMLANEVIELKARLAQLEAKG